MKTKSTILAILCCLVLSRGAAAEELPQGINAQIAIPAYGMFLDGLTSACTEITKETSMDTFAQLVPMFAQMLPPFAMLKPESRMDILIDKQGSLALLVTATPTDAFPAQDDPASGLKVLDMMGLPLYFIAVGDDTAVFAQTPELAKNTAAALKSWKPVLTGKGQLLLASAQANEIMDNTLDEKVLKQLEQDLDNFISNPSADGLPEGMSVELAVKLAKATRQALPDLLAIAGKLTSISADILFDKTDLAVQGALLGEKNSFTVTDKVRSVQSILTDEVLPLFKGKTTIDINPAAGRVDAGSIVPYIELNKALKAYEAQTREEEKEQEDAA